MNPPSTWKNTGADIYLRQMQDLNLNTTFISTSLLSADLQSTLLDVGETKMNMVWLLHSELRG